MHLIAIEMVALTVTIVIIIVVIIIDVIGILSFSSIGYHIEFIVIGIW